MKTIITIICLMLLTSNFSNAQITANSLRYNEQNKFDFMKSNTNYVTASNHVYNLNLNAYSYAKSGFVEDVLTSALTIVFVSYLSYGIIGVTSLSTIISGAVISQKQNVKNKNAKVIGLSVTGAITGAATIALPAAIFYKDKKKKQKKDLEYQNRKKSKATSMFSPTNYTNHPFQMALANTYQNQIQ